jgi:hypothetical protein
MPPLHQSNQHDPGRRDFLKTSAVSIAALATAPLSLNASTLQFTPGSNEPWYRRLTRWGQVNITEKDPQQYDVGWWKRYWKKTNTQGVIINAGGIVAYYPSRIPLHRQAQFLQGRDLFGELTKAAHEEGLAVFARMDSNRAHEDFFKAQPAWFSKDRTGNPYKAGDLYLSCIFGPYYTEHIPAVLTEIASTYQPQGFTDNSWSGITREMICYCENCRTSFRQASGNEIPPEKNWNDKTYRQWINWNYERRLEIWDLNNSVTKKAGGSHCTWAGMNSGSISGQSRAFRNYREICKRADIVMLDHQSRGNNELLQHNTELGLRVHGIAGWEKLVPESMAMYQAGQPTFRLSSKPAAEARMWMINGIAGGIQPWWHHISAYHEDRRMYDTAAPVLEWHKANEQFLVNRTPLAKVGVVWSQQNNDFFGRDEADSKVEQPWKGIIRALVKSRIPYLPLHADDIAQQSKNLSLLILPNVGCLTEQQADSLKKFVDKGGSIFATGETSLYDEWGDPLQDYALADVFGVHRIQGSESFDEGSQPKLAWGAGYHTYFRLHPELRAGVEGPHNASEPVITGKRHQVLDGFEKTDILPFGGFVQKLTVDQEVTIPLTFIPQFPVYPPETAWMREADSGIGGMYLSEKKNGARVIFMPAYIDRLYGATGLPDHGKLLHNVISWAMKGPAVLQVEGAGLLSCVAYEQKNRMIIHLVNQTSESAWNAPMEELIKIGPLKVKVELTKGLSGRDVELRVNRRKLESKVADGWASFVIPAIEDHELIVIR